MVFDEQGTALTIEPVCDDDPTLTPVADGDYQIFEDLSAIVDHVIGFAASPTGAG